MSKHTQVELTFEKVYETERQRFYKLSQGVTKAPNKNYDFKTEKEYNIIRLKEQYKQFHTDSIEYVAVSDAHTHIERLMFLAIPLDSESKKYGCMSALHLDGRHTMRIHGGDQRHVHPDEVYLRRLASANGFTFKLKQATE